jgi:hypothetical protein
MPKPRSTAPDELSTALTLLEIVLEKAEAKPKTKDSTSEVPEKDTESQS